MVPNCASEKCKQLTALISHELTASPIRDTSPVREFVNCSDINCGYLIRRIYSDHTIYVIHRIAVHCISTGVDYVKSSSLTVQGVGKRCTIGEVSVGAK